MSSAWKTASRSWTEAARGTHTFEIVGYSLKRGVGVGKYFRSRTFIVGGYDWTIIFYPDGLKRSSQESVSIYLELMSKNAKVRAYYSLGLIEPYSRELDVYFSRILPRSFESSTATRFGPTNSARFMLRSQLERDYVRNDCLKIQCDLTVVNESRLYDISEIQVPPCDITAHFAKLLDDEDGADVTFSVGEQSFLAHKIVLAARSPVFKAQFFGQMKEAWVRHVTIRDMEPAVFKALLRFIYTGLMRGVGDGLYGDDYRKMIWQLLAAADKYAMDRLKLMCQNILSKDLRADNVAATLVLADQHYCYRLKEVCIDFINSIGMNDVVATKGYAELKRSCPYVLADILEKTSRPRKD